MSEVITADSAIKLFGKTITPSRVVSDAIVTVQSQTSSAASASQDTKGMSMEETVTDTTTALSESSDDRNGPLKDSAFQNTCKDEQEPSDSSASQDKTTLKKPDKILPCPRCNSVDTKFCYYNNYNVNQPRHFCKNCQRYWTSGGAMRNVPVGSGRRKNKVVPISSYRHVMIPDALQMSGVDRIHFSAMRPNGYLFLGADREACEPSGPLGFPITFYPTTAVWGTANPSNGSTLGKRSREDNAFGQSKFEKGSFWDKDGSVFVPDNLRIDSINEAAKRCAWSTFEAKNEQYGFGYGMSLFKALACSEGNRSSSVRNTTTILEANPAALSRSLNFRENI